MVHDGQAKEFVRTFHFKLVLPRGSPLPPSLGLFAVPGLLPCRKQQEKTVEPDPLPLALQSANRVYKMFMDLDQRMTGSLSPNELAKYSTTMTKLVVSRVFEEHAGRCRSRGGPTNKGEMVFTVGGGRVGRVEGFGERRRRE